MMPASTQVQLTKEEAATISPHFDAIDREKIRLQGQIEGLIIAKRAMLAAILEKRKEAKDAADGADGNDAATADEPAGTAAADGRDGGAA